jgi:hypothetical protein
MDMVAGEVKHEGAELDLVVIRSDLLGDCGELKDNGVVDALGGGGDDGPWPVAAAEDLWEETVWRVVWVRACTAE